jgi:tRNA (cytidine/uridine-2'-O-)-methyltransferase
VNPPLHVVLFRPEIPQNTGNVGRTCAFTGARLHLVHPLGFAITDRHLRRSGMDYWKSLDLHEHADWAGFRASEAGPKRLWLLTTHATQVYWDVEYATGDGLLLGNEGHGCPDWLHEELGPERSVTIPQASGTLRSLNLATAAAVVTFEAVRQLAGKGTWTPAR